MKHDPTIDTMQKSDWDMQGPYVHPRQRTYDDLSMQEFDEVVSNFIAKIDRSIEGAKTKTKPVISVDDLITEKENRLKKYHQIRMEKMKKEEESKESKQVEEAQKTEEIKPLEQIEMFDPFLGTFQNK